MESNTPIFRDLTGEDQNPETTEIESLCVNCFENGQTRLLLTKIPFYKEVILMSFACDHCGHRNNEIQSGAEVKLKGNRYTLRVQNTNDLNRKIVKSDFSSVRIVELDFEIPAQSQKGEITTMEGVLERSIIGLQQEQTLRRVEHPDIAKQIDDFCEQLRVLKDGEKPFTVVIEDISGNCFIENPKAPASDHQLTESHFARTPVQDKLLGIFTREEISGEEEIVKEKHNKDENGILKPISEGAWPLEELHGEVLVFETLCPECAAPCQTNMKMTSIPHFKEVVIMATNCDACGHKTNEVKSGGGIEPMGIKFEVKIRGKEDFSRDVLKSETCSLTIPEIDCDVGCAALVGRFTTIEGILNSLKEVLSDNGAMFRDSSDEETKHNFDNFLKKLDSILEGEMAVTLVLDDPAGNSYVQCIGDDYAQDENLKISKYERSFEQNEEMGLNDMKVENYEKNEEKQSLETITE